MAHNEPAPEIEGRAEIDLSPYVSAVTRAFDLMRTNYFIVAVVCGVLLLFLVRVPALRGFPTPLDYLDDRKERIDTYNGQIRAVQNFAEAAKEGALKETIGELENEKIELLAEVYCTLTEDVRGCATRAERRLRDGRLTERDVVALVIKRRRYLQTVGTGLRVPILDQVVEPEHIPLIGTLLLGISLLVLRRATLNWAAGLRICFDLARSSGALKSAYLLLCINSILAGTQIVKPSHRWIRSVTIFGAHLIPVGLLLILLNRHRYIFFVTPTAQELAMTSVAAYAGGLLIIVGLGFSTALTVLRATDTLDRVRVQCEFSRAR